MAKPPALARAIIPAPISNGDRSRSRSTPATGNNRRRIRGGRLEAGGVSSTVAARFSQCSSPRFPNLVADREYKIRPSGEILAMQAKTITKSVRDATNGDFWPRIATLNRPHYATALCCAFLHLRNSIFRLGSVSNSSTISL